MISYILTRQFYRFRIDAGMYSRRSADLESFKSRYKNAIQNFATLQDEDTLCVCLSCLNKFDFKDFEQQMGSFVKDTALVYLDDVRALVRKAASKAVSLLSVKTKRGMDISLSHNVMFEILNKLLTIAISDNDMEVSFFNHLNVFLTRFRSEKSCLTH